MMNCEQVAHRASDYLERRLGWSGRLGVWLHLLVCSACKTYVGQLRLTRDALRAMRGAPAPEPQVDAVMAAMRRARDESPDSES